MLKHIVLWKLKPSAEGGSKDENARRVKSRIEALRTKIAGVRVLEVGINVNPEPAAYDVALYSEFASREDLDRYQKDPEHVAVAEFIGKVREHRIVVDYEG